MSTLSTLLPTQKGVGRSPKIASEVRSLQGSEDRRGVLHRLDRMPGANAANGAKVKTVKNGKDVPMLRVPTRNPKVSFLPFTRNIWKQLKEARHLLSLT